MPELPSDISSWIIAALVGVAVYFLKDLRAAFQETSRRSVANEQKALLLEQQIKHQDEAHRIAMLNQGKINEAILDRARDLGILIEKLQDRIFAADARITKLEAEKG